MTDILRMSELYAPTLRESPADADIASHRLLLRAGMIRKTAAGVYSFLPLGRRVLVKVENIIREEMDAIGAQEIVMPALQPAELWHESERWDDYGPELMRLADRHDHDFCLGPTHEELITDLVRNELTSYRQLPLSLYQIQTKFRDEIRPRFGLLRSREFIMKDAYSFHATQSSLQETYDEMSSAYERICDRCALDYCSVEADPGQIGGKVTREFMALAENGEAELVHCSCGYAADAEAGVCIAHPSAYEVDGMEKIATPDVHTIDALAEFLGTSPSSTVKALSGKDGDGNLVVMFVPGDHRLNELKALRAVEGFELLTDAEMLAFGLHKGSMGPVGLPEGARVVADRSLEEVGQWAIGANEEGFHYVGACPGEDFDVDLWADLCIVQPGDTCPECGGTLEGARGIEVSQVFQLGDRYSRTMGATFTDEEGAERPFLMGCYGVGVTRTLAAVVEQHNDEQGIIWPASVAPAHIYVVSLAADDEEVRSATENFVRDISDFNFEVIVDDRDERAGVKFADADLIGCPMQIIIGKRGLDERKIEMKLRRTGEKTDIPLANIAELMSHVRRRIKAGALMDIVNFDGIFG